MKELFLSIGVLFSSLVGGITPDYTQNLQAFSLKDFWEELWTEDSAWTVQKVQMRPETAQAFENLHREWMDDYHRLIDGKFILDEDLGKPGTIQETEEIGTYKWVEDSESPNKYIFREGQLVQSGKHADIFTQYLRTAVSILKETNQEVKESLRLSCQICQTKQQVAIPCPMCF
ncbi:hypothetical protein K9L27_04295 [Candidatus Gracilibacteria bacterium]|nr:hypothetical protein [Candidatus Gracilibacteria bacterium]